MKRRWKVGIAFAVVGLAGFLVWAFLSDPNHGVAIRFMGYETNRIQSDRHWMTTNTSGIEARFCLTNGNQGAINCGAYEGIPLFEIETKTSGEWSTPPRSRVGPIDSFKNMVLPSAQSFCFTVPVPDLSQPLRLTLPYATNSAPPGLWGTTGRDFVVVSGPRKPAANTFLARLQRRISSWLHSNQEFPSVSITIQD